MYRQVHNGIMISSTRIFQVFVFLKLQFYASVFTKFKLCGDIKWIGQRDIIMQSANLLYKKVQN